MPVVSESMYPTIENVLNLTRVHLNDTFAGATNTPGEGRIFTDSAPFTLPILNSAIQEYVREIETAGVPTTKRDMVITLNGAVTPINGPLGLGVPDPSIQVYIGFAGYFDGSLMHQWPQLPADLLDVRRVWERTTGTNLTFTELGEIPVLPSRYQDYSLGNWVFEKDAIYFNGALVSKDLRIEYLSAGFAQYYSNTTPPSSFPTTYIPFLDSMQALSYLCAAIFNESRNPPTASAALRANATRIIAKIKNRYVRRAQRVGGYSREAYGEAGDLFGWF